ncbi:MAG: hypothetical protein QW331_00195 [Candidatus Woesearchaeota archaeon]
MLDKKDFQEMQQELQKYDEKRELLIKKSRDILKLSKQVIYAVHRNELSEAANLLKNLEKEKNELNKISKHDPHMLSEGSFRIALQEYVEAALYYEFVKNEKLPSHKKLDVDSEHFVMGLCDLTGELARRAVYLAGKNQTKNVVKIRDLIDEIYGELLKFDFRENEVRRKFDAIKYEINKIEELVLDLKLRKR